MKDYTANWIVYIYLVCFLAERVTVINVGDLLQHFLDLLRELEISSCRADGDLCRYEVVKFL